MGKHPVIFDLDFLEIFNDAVNDFQTLTGYTLERQDAERLMMQIFSNMVFKWGGKWQEASKQNFLEYMTGILLDAYGDSNEEPRLASTPSGTIVRFTLTASLEMFYPVHRNTVVTGKNSKGTFTFRSLEDTYGEPGDTYIDVTVAEFIDELTNSGDAANRIEIGDVDTLEDTDNIYSLVDSVANIVETFGGHPSESDDHYKNRLRYILGSPATAGPLDGYKFHALSASVGVLDVGILKPAWEIDIYVLPFNFDTEILGDSSSQLDNMALTGLTVSDTDKGRLYWSLTGTTPTRTLAIYSDSAKSVQVASYTGANGVGLTLTPTGVHTVGGTFDLTGSTVDSDYANYLSTYAVPMCAVNELMNPTVGETKIRPTNDTVNVALSSSKSFVISKCNIEIKTGNVETAWNTATRVIKGYRDKLRSKAGLDAVKSELSGLIQSAIGEGYHDIELEFDSSAAIKLVAATQAQYLTTSMPTINVTVYTP